MAKGVMTNIEDGKIKLDNRPITTFVCLAKGMELDLCYVLEHAGYDLGHTTKEDRCPQQQ